MSVTQPQQIHKWKYQSERDILTNCCEILITPTSHYSRKFPTEIIILSQTSDLETLSSIYGTKGLLGNLIFLRCEGRFWIFLMKAHSVSRPVNGGGGKLSRRRNCFIFCSSNYKLLNCLGNIMTFNVKCFSREILYIPNLSLSQYQYQCQLLSELASTNNWRQIFHCHRNINNRNEGASTI